MSNHQKYTAEYERLQRERDQARAELEIATRAATILETELAVANKHNEIRDQLFEAVLVEARKVVYETDEHAKRSGRGIVDAGPLWSAIAGLATLVRPDEDGPA